MHTFLKNLFNLCFNHKPKYKDNQLYDFIDSSDPSGWSNKVKPNTKVIYVETITNPLMDIGALDKVAEFAKENREDEWITGRGWNQVLWESNELPRQARDKCKGKETKKEGAVFRRTR